MQNNLTSGEKAVKTRIQDESVLNRFIDYCLDKTRAIFDDNGILGKIVEDVRVNDKFLVYDDGEVNDYLFALNQVINYVLLQEQADGNESRQGYFTLAFNEFLNIAKNDYGMDYGMDEVQE